MILRDKMEYLSSNSEIQNIDIIELLNYIVLI